MNLSKHIEITFDGSTAAGTSAVNGSEVDMSGFEGCVFSVEMATDAAGNNAKVQQRDAGGSWADLEGTEVQANANGDLLVIDVYRPRKQMLRLVVTRGTSTALGPIVAQKYGAHAKPTTQPATVIAELHVSPAEGTP